MRLLGLLNKGENNKNKEKDNKVTKTVKKQLTTFAVTMGLKILPLLLVAAIITSIINWIVKIFESKNTVDAIYEILEVDDVYNLIQIKGNETDGYYLDFVEGIDDKLDDTLKYLNNTAGVKSGIDKEFLKKIIKAEIYTQVPDLGGNIGTSSGFQGAVNIVRITPNKEINSLTNTGAGQETIIDQDESDTIEIINKEKIQKQEEIIKKWSEGKELTLGATAFVYSQEESRLNPGEKIDYWVPQKSEKTQNDLKISQNEKVTYTGNYSISVNKLTNEGLIYVEIEQDDIKGYIKYNYILKDSNDDNSNNTTDEEFVDSGYVEESEQKVVDTIDSNAYKLTYVPKEKFDEYMTNADKSVLNYFTLDDVGNLITAKWETKEDGTLEFKNNSTINLKSALQNLVMHYEYLMYFYINADYEDFSSDLADEVLNSKVIVAIEDNITTSYTKKTIEEKKVSKLSEFSYDWTEKENTETTIEYCNTKVEIIYADTWCVKMVNKDIYNEELLNLSVGQSKNLKLPGKVTETTSNSISEETMSEEGNDTKEETETYVDTDGKTKTRKVTKKIPYKKYEHTITDNHGISNSYASSNEEKEPESKENVFVNLYKKHKMYNRLNEKRLLKVLERDTKTANLVNLTKYLMHMATGNNYDNVLEFDFNEFFENSFTDITANYGDWDGTGSNEDFIKAVAPYAVADMEQHQIYASVTIAQAIIESGWGKDNIAINYKNFFGMKAKGISNTGNEYWDGTGVQLNASEGGKSYFRVYDSLKNSIYDHGRNFHVTAVYSANGVLDCISQNLGPKEQLRRIAVSGYAVYRDGSISKPDGKRTYDQYLYEEFIQKYDLEKYDKMTSSDFQSTNGNQEIVEIAKTKIGCPYVLGARGPNSFDCSGFVYWVYGQIGINVPTTTESYKPYINTEKEISWEQAQPGDILLILNTERNTTYGHAGIYLGNDEYIHAPQTGDSVKISSGAKSKFKHVFRFKN